MTQIRSHGDQNALTTHRPAQNGQKHEDVGTYFGGPQQHACQTLAAAGWGLRAGGTRDVPGMELFNPAVVEREGVQ